MSKLDRLLPPDAGSRAAAKSTRLVSANPARVGDLRAPQRQQTERQPTPATPRQARSIDRYEQYTAGTIKRCAYAYRDFVAKGGYMFVSMAGALSTAGIGIWLNPLIRQGFVRGLSVTGANLEEDFFRLLGYHHYEQLPDYQAMSVTDDVALLKQHKPRVTSVAISEQHAIRPLEEAVIPRWKAAQVKNEPVFTHRVLYDVLLSKQLADRYEADPETSWLIAAAEMHLPVMVPGAEDSTLGQVFTAQCELGELKTTTLKNGYDYGREMIQWIKRSSAGHAIGFFQLGGGIAGDFSICGVPMIRQDMHDTSAPLWSFYAHIGDGQESWGGYSAALASEKASWGKLDEHTETFVMQSDATVVFPQIAEFLLDW